MLGLRASIRAMVASTTSTGESWRVRMRRARSARLVSPSLGLLRVEGVIEADAPGGDDAPMRLTAAGRAELDRLMTARMRGPLGEVSRLILALKLRFLHLLDPPARRQQLDLLAEAGESELVRLADLRQHHADEPGHLVEWL